MVLNPVRARMVASPGDWPWSSYGVCVQDQFAPSWLDTDWLPGQFGAQRSRARRAFAKFVVQGKGLASPLLATKHQLLLGDAQFIEQQQPRLKPEELREVSIADRRFVASPLHAYQEKYADRNEAMAQAYRSGADTMADIATFFDVHYLTVSRAVRAFEQKL